MSDIKKTANKVRSKLKSESGLHPGPGWRWGARRAHSLCVPRVSPARSGPLGLAFLHEGALLPGKACLHRASLWECPHLS